MVKVKKREYLHPDGSIDAQAWLHNIAERRRPGSIKLIAQACQLGQLTGGDTIPRHSQKSCLQYGLEMAEILIDMHLDQHSIAAAILYNNVQYAELSLDIIAEELGPTVAKLITGAEQMDTSRVLLNNQHLLLASKNRNQIDNLRKMLLAIVEDVRVVLIKLAERATLMHAAAKMSEDIRHALALETFHIYAPLANRLGIGQLKWELEDLSFRYMHPETYKTLAKKLAAKRIEREKFIEEVIENLNASLQKAGVEHFEIMGAQNIYIAFTARCSVKMWGMIRSMM